MRKGKAVSLVMLSMALAIVLAVSERPNSYPPKPVSQVKGNARKVFLYSVIPGGAGSEMELRNALFHDRVAASHYAGFRLEQTRMETLPEPRKVFVSYRIADRIYWTRKRLLLPKGETILTDGVSSARTRCGNRISETPQLPVNAKHEPADDILNSETPESVHSNWNLAEAETEESGEWADRLTSTAAPTGDLLDRFGPESVGSQTGLSSSPKGAPSPSAVGGSGIQSGSAIVTRSEFAPSAGGQIAASLASRLASPKGAPVESAATTPIASIPKTSSVVEFSFPELPLRNHVPLQSADETWLVKGSTSLSQSSEPIVSFSHPTLRSESPLPASILPPAPRQSSSSFTVQVPEPRTLGLSACGIVLFGLRFLRKRRALR